MSNRECIIENVKKKIIQDIFCPQLVLKVYFFHSCTSKCFEKIICSGSCIYMYLCTHIILYTYI